MAAIFLVLRELKEIKKYNDFEKKTGYRLDRDLVTQLYKPNNHKS